MFFILLLGLGAVSLASVSGFFSIWGLAHTFPGKFEAVIAMGIVIEYGKLIGVSFLYRFWDRVGIGIKTWVMKPMIALILITMVITAVGHYGYLSSGYQSDILPLKQMNERVKILEEEKERKIDRKKAIDVQISQLPTNTVKGRIRLINQFKEEQKAVTERIDALDKEISDIKSESLKTETHVGPITYIAKALGVETDKAVNILVILIIIVFDPMAVLLTIATNVAIRDKEKTKPMKAIQTPVVFTNSPPTPDESYIDLAGDNMKGNPELPETLPAEPEPIPEPEPEIASEGHPEPPEPVVEDDSMLPPSIKELRSELTALSRRSDLSDAEQMRKTKIEETIRHYEAQNFVLGRTSALNR